MKEKLIIPLLILIVGTVVGLGYGAIFLFVPPKYEAVTKFAYSVNDGETYHEGLQVIDVGARYYLSIEISVARSKDSPIYNNNVSVTLIMPNVTIVDDYLFDSPGTRLPREQTSDSIIYNFKIVPSTNPQKFRVIIEFIPNQEGLFTIELSYGKELDDAYNKTETVRFEVPNKEND